MEKGATRPAALDCRPGKYRTGGVAVLSLPPSLTSHFQDASGRFDYRALLCAPDEDLLTLARQMPVHELAGLYRRLRDLRLGWAQRLMAQAAGVDVDFQRSRLLRVLEAAARSPREEAACQA
jgi:hypothetical protein